MKPKVVATDAECRKQLKYEAISQTHCFNTAAVERLGALGEEATAFLKKNRWTHCCNVKGTPLIRVFFYAAEQLVRSSNEAMQSVFLYWQIF